MNWLNYHHLLYFWTMAREGSVSRAAELLHLSQPTVSGQLRQLERALGKKLYQRNGQSLELTEAGRVVFDYAERIFTTGQELVRALELGGSLHRRQITIGVPDFLSKSIVARLIEPLFTLPDSPLIICREGELEELLGELAMHRVDMVLSDSAVGSQFKIPASSLPLGFSTVQWMTQPAMATELALHFPKSLDHKPLVLPTANTVLRRSIEQWLDHQEFTPHIVAEIEDSGLMKSLAARLGYIAPVPAFAAQEALNRYQLTPIGTLEGVTVQYFLIVGDKQSTSDSVQAMVSLAKDWFGNT
jgi:LysR family transcriptional activator of nhaA